MADLRSLTGTDIDHARNDVRVKSNGTKRMILDGVGCLELRWDTLEVSGARGQCVVIRQAVSDNRQRRELAALEHRHGVDAG
ncbi:MULTISPECIES: hypothetical protein [unclassified Gordonia (in: high G+C Gram-positive bacteria)]